MTTSHNAASVMPPAPDAQALTPTDVLNAIYRALRPRYADIRRVDDIAARIMAELDPRTATGKVRSE